MRRRIRSRVIRIRARKPGRTFAFRVFLYIEVRVVFVLVGIVPIRFPAFVKCCGNSFQFAACYFVRSEPLRLRVLFVYRLYSQYFTCVLVGLYPVGYFLVIFFLVEVIENSTVSFAFGKLLYSVLRFFYTVISTLQTQTIVFVFFSV